MTILAALLCSGLQCVQDVCLASALQAVEQGCQRSDRQPACNAFGHLDSQLVRLTRDERLKAHNRRAGAGTGRFRLLGRGLGDLRLGPWVLDNVEQLSGRGAPADELDRSACRVMLAPDALDRMAVCAIHAVKRQRVARRDHHFAIELSDQAQAIDPAIIVCGVEDCRKMGFDSQPNLLARSILAFIHLLEVYASF